ncbi:hypothetical protein [Parapontixanthobacter aurantiacus]|uniref:hypothetical protein n=1 Tax=Parapontixanthobacter aurantiacus TaxID=1463599 RepID=UPI001928BD2D|nr:hypothetical protein [Parapontixanthobacter aurantiacus]
MREKRTDSHGAATADFRSDYNADETLDWRTKISDHIAYALVIYTGLQIFATIHAMNSSGGTGGSILPYLALVVLVGIVIPFCRKFEKRWTSLSENAAHDPALAGRFRRDRLTIWLLAIGVPLAMTGIVKIAMTS